MLKQLRLMNIPELDNYRLYPGPVSVVFAKIDFVYSFVHLSDNLFSDDVINDIQTYLNQNVNGIYTNYVIFYSPLFPNESFLGLEKQYENFVYVHLPLLAFGQALSYVNMEQLPEINYKYKKNFCCLINRSTNNRRQLFNFLQEKNLLELGHVSYRNIHREWIQDQSDTINDSFIVTVKKLGKPYKNFKDIQYTDEMTDNPRQYAWYFPLLDFLFDFSIETFDESPPFLTEKSTKAFFWGKIPVSTSCRNLMHYIEQFGFDIFRDVVDYKYDIQRDPMVRMELFLQEVYKLATMDITTISNLENRLENNRRLICTLVRRSQTILKDINLNTKYIVKNRDKFLGY